MGLGCQEKNVIIQKLKRWQKRKRGLEGEAREQVWRRLAGLEEGVEGAEGEEAEGDKEGVRRRRAKEDELVGFLPYFPVVKLSKFLDEKANR